MQLVCFALQLFVLVIIAWIVLSYVVAFGRLSWGHPVRRVYDFLAKVIDPILRPIRAVVPPVRLGGAGLDLSPMILIFGVFLLQVIICG